jgi:glycopeptide antibiotics resistance protein
MQHWIEKILENKWLAWAITLFIFILCTIPSSGLPQGNDKMAHFVAFGVWAFFWLFSYKKAKKTIVLGILFGIFIECWQYILPKSFHRGFEWLDMLADAIGVFIGVGIALFFQKVWFRN